MASASLLLVHNKELNAVLTPPLHLRVESSVDQHLQGAVVAGPQYEDDVVLRGGKAADARHAKSQCHRVLTTPLT